MVRSHTTGMAAEAEFLLFGVGSDPGTPTMLRVQITEEGSDLKGLSGNRRALIKQMIADGETNVFIAAHLGVPKSTAHGWIQEVKRDMGLIPHNPPKEEPSELSTEESTTLSTEISTVMSDEVAEDTPTLIHDQTSCITQVGVVMDPLQQAENREMMMEPELSASVVFSGSVYGYDDFKDKVSSIVSEVTEKLPTPKTPSCDDILSKVHHEYDTLVARGERLKTVYNWLDHTRVSFGDDIAAQLYLRNTELLGVG